MARGQEVGPLHLGSAKGKRGYPACGLGLEGAHRPHGSSGVRKKTGKWRAAAQAGQAAVAGARS